MPPQPSSTFLPPGTSKQNYTINSSDKTATSCFCFKNVLHNTVNRETSPFLVPRDEGEEGKVSVLCGDFGLGEVRRVGGVFMPVVGRPKKEFQEKYVVSVKKAKLEGKLSLSPRRLEIATGDVSPPQGTVLELTVNRYPHLPPPPPPPFSSPSSLDSSPPRTSPTNVQHLPKDLESKQSNCADSPLTPASSKTGAPGTRT